MDVIYQAADEDFNFFEAQARELDAERNQSIITIMFRTLSGTRHKTKRRQVASVPPMLIMLGATSPTIIPSMVATLSMPVTTTNPGQDILTTAINDPAMAGQEMSVPETVLPVVTTNNESQLGGSYLNSHVNQVIPNNNISMCSSDSLHRKILKLFLMKG